MIKATVNDKELMISILSKAFQNEKSVNYMIKQDQKAFRIYNLMDYSFEVCNLFGEMWLSDDRKACALILHPHKIKTTLKSILLDIKFVFKVVGPGGVIKLVKWSSMIKRVMPVEELMYLWFIGVDPSEQYKGIGTLFLTQILERSESEKLSVCLETSTIENLPWYRKFNFGIYHEQDMGYQLFFLKREKK